MSYEDFIKKHKKQIEEAKKALNNSSLKQSLEYVESEEFKKDLEKIREQERVVHKNIIESIERLQKSLVNG